MAASMSKDYDLVIFGASGFTGQYVVEELARTVDEEGGLKWAVAGRSMQKIQNVMVEAQKQTGIASIISNLWIYLYIPSSF